MSNTEKGAYDKDGKWWNQCDIRDFTNGMVNMFFGRDKSKIKIINKMPDYYTQTRKKYRKETGNKTSIKVDFKGKEVAFFPDEYVFWIEEKLKYTEDDLQSLNQERNDLIASILEIVNDLDDKVKSCENQLIQKGVILDTQESSSNKIEIDAYDHARKILRQVLRKHL